jgi:hypothetical protein
MISVKKVGWNRMPICLLRGLLDALVFLACMCACVDADAEIEDENGYELQKEEVRTIMIEFLRSLGLSMGFSTRLTKKSGKFMAHLHSIVLNRYSARFAEGRVLHCVSMF